MISVTAVLWGLLGALLIGASDCIARVTTRSVDTGILFLFIMGCSTVILLCSGWLTGNLPPFHAYAWLVSAVSGLLNLLALYFLYLALVRGPVTVASPAASTFVVMLVLLNVATGEPWTVLQLVAVLIVFAGVAQLARHSENAAEDQHYSAAWLKHTALYGLAAAVTVTVRMYMAQEAADAVGPLHALTLNRMFALAGTLILLAWQLLQHITLRWPKGRTLTLVLLQTLTESLALGAFLIGSSSASRVGTTIGFSAFSVITALLAWVWLGEAIGKRRGIWMLVVMLGLALGGSGF